MDLGITFGTIYKDSEMAWRRYEHLSQIRMKEAWVIMKKDIGIIIFLSKRNLVSFVLKCVSKENNKYTFDRYMIPYYNRYEADLIMNAPSDSFEKELDVKPNKIAFQNDRFLLR